MDDIDFAHCTHALTFAHLHVDPVLDALKAKDNDWHKLFRVAVGLFRFLPLLTRYALGRVLEILLELLPGARHDGIEVLFFKKRSMRRTG